MNSRILQWGSGDPKFDERLGNDLVGTEWIEITFPFLARMCEISCNRADTNLVRKFNKITPQDEEILQK